jgi:hypothetical protein
VKAKNIEALRSTENLLEAIRLCLYGEKLYKTRAVAVLEEYYSARDSVIGGPISARANLLLAMTDAIDNENPEFLTDFAKAYKIRSRKALRDHWKVADYVLRTCVRHWILDPGKSQQPVSDKPFIKQEELERLFVEKKCPNIPRIIGHLKIRKWVIDGRESEGWAMAGLTNK